MKSTVKASELPIIFLLLSSPVYAQADADQSDAKSQNGSPQFVQFALDAPTISSPTHSSQSTWYTTRDVLLTWTAPVAASGIDGYSYGWDNSSGTMPDTSVDTVNNTILFSNQNPGIWYFHIRAKDKAGNWGAAGQFKVNIADINPLISVTPASQDFGSIQIGTTTDRTFTVQNFGNGTLTGNASIPSPYMIVSGGTYNLGGPGGSQIVTVRYSPTAEGADNTTVTFTGGGGATRAVSGSAYITDLLLAKTHVGSFTVGVDGTYTLTVTNVGSGATAGTITVTDTLPTGLSYVSAIGTGWTCGASSQEVICTNASSLAIGATSAITLVVGVADTANPKVTNTAVVSLPGDSNPANNTASDLTTVLARPGKKVRGQITSS